MRDGILPSTKSCFVCGRNNPAGLHLRNYFEQGRVFLNYVTRESDAGYHGIFHGGLAVALLDEVMAWAAIVATSRVFVAVEVTARFLAPIQIGESIYAEGRVTRSGSRLCLTEGIIKNQNGEIVVEAGGKFMPMPASAAHHAESDFVVSADAIHPSEILAGIKSL